MTAKKIHLSVKDGKISMDFEGFPGNACDTEEAALRLIFGRLGVETIVEESEKKPEPQGARITEREKC